MRKNVWVVLAGISIGAGCGLFAKKPPVAPEGSIRHVAWKDAPKPVSQRVIHDYPGSTIDQIDLTKIDGFDQYTVYLTTRAGEHRIVRYDQGGNSVEGK
jgi:hypothetical protein